MRRNIEIRQVDDPDAADEADWRHWRQCSSAERVQGLEQIHKNLWIMKNGTEAGFHRVHRVIEQRGG